ncbi:MAG: hypothetical protein HY741_24365 [Chloroflexi bacterium]|nr:hypothetical protein [Chloroflexota bacterium]
MTLQEILADIHACEETIRRFERKYGIRSETFYPAYMSGEEPEDDEWVADFGEWAAMYRIWLTRQAEYRNEIQRLQKNPKSIAGLVHVAA